MAVTDARSVVRRLSGIILCSYFLLGSTQSHAVALSPSMSTSMESITPILGNAVSGVGLTVASKLHGHWLPLLLGLTSLVVLHSVVVKGGQQRKRTIAMYLFAMAVSVIAVGAWMQPPRFLPTASTSGLVVKIADDLKAALSDPKKPEIVLIDGGSFAARGIDGDRLEQRLEEKAGRKFKVVFLAVPGGNQPERRALLEDAISLLTHRERAQLSGSDVTMMLEIHEEYDRYPLAQLAKNPRSDRAYAYMRPGIAWDALKDGIGDLETGRRIQLLEDAMVLASSNALNVGKASRVRPASSVSPLAEQMTLRRPKESFRFRGLRDVIGSEGKRDDSIVDEFPEGNIRKRREHIAAASGVREPRVIYFSVPSMTLRHMRYAQGFCIKYASESDGCITHGNLRLLRRLNHKKYWYDGGHLLEPGAAQYTRWLADRLALEMVKEEQEEVR